jgi:hypothetical protein
MSCWLTKEHENAIVSLFGKGLALVEGIKGDFKNECFNSLIIKSPLNPLCQRGVFSGQ